MTADAPAAVPKDRVESYWLERRAPEVPADSEWLGPGELAHLSTLRFAKRRWEWRLGRWTAKCAVAAHLGLASDLAALAAVEIQASASGAPEAYVNGTPASCSISLSHRGGLAACAVASSDVALGCDLELVESRTDAFISDYFTQAEQRQIARAGRDRDLLVMLFWSAKESALKALREGLRLDPRALHVTCDIAHHRESWSPLEVEYEGRMSFQGWWMSDQRFVRTLVAAPAPAPPVALDPTPRASAAAAR